MVMQQLGIRQDGDGDIDGPETEPVMTPDPVVLDDNEEPDIGTRPNNTSPLLVPPAEDPPLTSSGGNPAVRLSSL